MPVGVISINGNGLFIVEQGREMPKREPGKLSGETWLGEIRLEKSALER